MSIKTGILATKKWVISLVNGVIKKSSAMTQPWLWDVGVEQSFGNNIYGIRYQGTIKCPTSTSSRTDLVLNPSFSQQWTIFKVGGTLFRSKMGTTGSANSIIPSPWATTSGTTGEPVVTIGSTTSGLTLYYVDTSKSLGDVPYELWLIYKK